MKPAIIAAPWGVSRKCVYAWLGRYAAEGEADLAIRRPTRRCPNSAIPMDTASQHSGQLLRSRARRYAGGSRRR
ncbi:hypothetical protein F7P69_02625 [Cellulosimicrobium funkei]|nr:hypothetical protein [Cellulosimicrobium funkei]